MDMERKYAGFWVRDRNFYRTLLTLSLPMVGQNIITFGVILSDNLMVGSLGEDAISGLYMGTLLQTVLQILLFGLESAVLILCAQYWGKGDTDRIKTVISIGMRSALIVTCAAALGTGVFAHGIMALLLPDEPAAAAEGTRYLRIVCPSYVCFCISQILIVAMRSVEIVRIGLINSITAFCVNVSLNWVFIFGHLGMPALGTGGAALATDISRAVELAVVVYFVLRVDDRLRLRLCDFRKWDRGITSDLVKYGTPLLLGQVVWAVNNIMQSWIVGQMGKAAVSAASITGTFDRMLWMGTWGVAAATGIMVGKAIGAREYDKVRQYAKTMQAIFFGIGVCSAGIVLACGEGFLSFYQLTPQTRELGREFMLVLSAAVIGRCYQAPSLFGLVKAGGDTAFVFKNDTFWVFCWVLPGALLSLHYGAPCWVVYAFLLSDQVAKCFVALVKINRFNWMRNLTRDDEDDAKSGNFLNGGGQNNWKNGKSVI